MGASAIMMPADLSLNKYSLEYDAEELCKATKNFSEKQMIGSGAFGAVFRGVVLDGTEIAVKVMDVPAESGFEEEVRVLSKFRHPNLVILMGFARRNSQRMLVYELLAGGDVFKRLQLSGSDVKPFPWSQRVSAAFDSACGLSHLHNSKPKVFHRDIKTANIILDRGGNAKMADFGLACLSTTETFKVKRAAGTVGYACPLYASRGIVTEGSEVYSFGIVLLELLTALSPAWQEQVDGGKLQYRFLLTHIQVDLNKALSMADPKASWPEAEARTIATLALRCTAAREEMRPSFIEIISILRPLRDVAWPSECQVPATSLEEIHPKVQAVPVHWQQQPPFQQSIVQAEAWPMKPPANLHVLWTLPCTYSECGLPEPEAPLLVRRGDPTAAASMTLTIGRYGQDDLFARLLPNDDIRGMVSRQHFQIWAIRENEASMACRFFVGNLSMNLTAVNGTLLDAPGRSLELHHGDLIALGRHLPDGQGYTIRYRPFIQFRFDLSGSVLQDAALAAPTPAESLKAQDDGPVVWGTALAGTVAPLFILEAGGTALVSGVADKHRKIIHGPLLRPATSSGSSISDQTGQAKSAPVGAARADAFPELILGRGYACSFWMQLLQEPALQTFSREHLAIVPLEAGGSSGSCGCGLKGLSDKRPIRLWSAASHMGRWMDEQSMIEAAELLETNRVVPLWHGDVIVVCTGRGLTGTFWLRFQDMRRMSLPSPDDGLCSIPPAATPSTGSDSALRSEGSDSAPERF